MATVTNDVDAIRRQMAQIRRELHEDMQGVVAGTEAAFDWQYYVRLYPWAALAGAFVLGFLVVSRKHHRSQEAESSKDTGQLGLASSHQENRSERRGARHKSGAFGLLIGFLGPIAMRAAQNYASHYVENLLLQQNSTGPGMSPGSTETPSRPDPYRPGPPGAM